MSLQLDLYRRLFETPFLDATSLFYRTESTQFIATHSTADYMRKVEQRLAEERRRARQYLHMSTEPALLARCDEALVGAHLEALWGAFGALLVADNFELLARLYALLAPRPPNVGLQPLREPFMQHVTASSLATVAQLASSVAEQTEPDPTEYVQTLLKTHGHFKTMIKDAFQNDAAFNECLDRASRKFVNDNAVCKGPNANTSKSAELIARHCDALLRKTPANADIVAVEKALDAVLTIFVYIDDQVRSRILFRVLNNVCFFVDDR